MQIRSITPGDRQPLKEFASRIPPEDIVFTDRSLMSDIAVASWTQAVPAKRLARLHAQVRDGLGAYQDLVILSRWLQPQPSAGEIG